MVPLLILAYCCCRKQRRNHKKGLENKTLKVLTTSRHSLNESSGHGVTVSTTKGAKTSMEPSWKKESPESNSSSGISSAKQMDLVRSLPPDNDIKSDTNSTFDRDSTRSPVTSSGSGGKTSPTDSKSSGSPANWSRPALDSTSAQQKRNSRQRYEGVYYTHEPIKNAPLVDFPNTVLDVEINHRNTEV